MARLPGQFHTLIDGGTWRNAIEIEQLESSQAQSDQNLWIKPGVRPGEKFSQLLIKKNLPTEYAENQRRGQMSIAIRKGRDRIAAQQIVGVRPAALNGKEDLKCCPACGGYPGHGVQPRRMPAAIGNPRKNSAADRRFLPSS